MTSEKLLASAGRNIQGKATVIWNVANSLFRAYKPHEYGLVILPMTVIKRFHDCLLPTHARVLEQYEKIKHLAVKKGTEKSRQGKISSTLKPIVDMYNSLDPKQRSAFRRTIRAFVKWYQYISQITRMFDRDLHKEYLFCSYLSKLLPGDETAIVDLDDILKLEFYKLEKTFEGSIALEQKKTAIQPPEIKPTSLPADPKKSILDEVIDAINEMYQGDFTEADRVIIGDLLQHLLKDEKLRKLARSADPQIFKNNQFPKFFEETAQTAYMESTERYTKMFEDTAKYFAIISAVGAAVYCECRNSKKTK